ncbi:CheR family methyltransferase [Chitinibacter sp. S2-10]|uniref:CheR family methyltransferase n=1 Tax=Chitinibacter sp. S2-10 TaxID=3373597 RepID=UPI003977DC6A
MTSITKTMPASPVALPYSASDAELELFRHFFQQTIGVNLPNSKKSLLTGRLGKRLHDLNLPDLRAYHSYITMSGNEDERQRAIDLITTNETYFFRESKHFDYLADSILPSLATQQDVRIWSAASSTGEEAYSIAMILDKKRPAMAWNVEGSDVSTRVLAYAQRGLYPIQRGQQIPQSFLKQHCLRGNGQYEGHFLVDQRLRERVQFSQRNLLEPQTSLGQFDVIFLRNVLIYFENETKAQVIRNVCRQLKPGGWFIIGHAESLNGIETGLKLKPSGSSIFQLEH